MKELKDYLYYEEKNPDIKIYCGDCLEIMPLLPKVDLVVTDPPYGIGFDRENLSMSCGMRKDGSQRKYHEWSAPKAVGYKTEDWDSAPPPKEIFDAMFKASKDQIIWGGNYFDLPLTGGWLVWDKMVVMPTLSKCELAWTSFLGHIEIKHYLWAGFRKDRPEERYHPTQKPLQVVKWAIQQCKYWDTPLTILDPFGGSGTTAVACKELKKACTIIEINEKYCEIARKRLVNTQVPFI